MSYADEALADCKPRKKPRSRWGYSLGHSVTTGLPTLFVGGDFGKCNFTHNSKFIRSFAAWLNKAADWMDDQNERMKAGKR